MISKDSLSFAAKSQTKVDVVCFGMITPAIVLVVDQLPEQNTGALVDQYSDFISDDAAVIACLLRGWDVRSGIIGTDLGDDGRGRWVVERLKSLGVQGEIRLDPHVITPFEVNVSDHTGERTYFWQRKPKVLDTLDNADLHLIEGSRLLYVDWYDGDRILRPIKEAKQSNIPVFLNLEYGHQEPDILTRYAEEATICQAVTDAAQRGSVSPLAVVQKLLKAGVKIAIVTLAGEGCLAASDTEMIRVWTPSIEPVDGCGAGATFSAGFIYGYLKDWELEDIARFATAAASLKCAQIGLDPPQLAKCLKIAKSLKTEYLTP